MSETTNPLLKNVSGISTTSSLTHANFIQGAQLGAAPHLEMLDMVTPEQFSPLVAVVTHSPTMFAKFPGMTDAWKAMVERHCKSITNVDFEYTIGKDEVMKLPDGQSVNMPGKAQRSPVNPNIVYPEVKGNYIWEFHRKWISLMDHPDSHASNLASLLDGDLDPMIFSAFSSDICFIQFDKTYLPQNIITSFMVTHVFPENGGGMLGAKKEIGSITLPERSVTYNGIVQHNDNTHAAGIKIAELLGLHKVNHDITTEIAKDGAIAKNSSGKGLEAEMADISSTFRALS